MFASAVADDVRFIPLTRGLFVAVDAADFDWLSAFKWQAAISGKDRTSPVFVAARTVCRGGQSRTLYMAREIMKPPAGMVVDFKSGDRLDCRRGNLRVCTRAECTLNRIGTRKSRSSRYKGVWRHRNGRWVAEFRSQYLGSFGAEGEAAKAYDRAAIAFNPTFALLNFPSEGLSEAERRCAVNTLAAAYEVPA